VSARIRKSSRALGIGLLLVACGQDPGEPVDPPSVGREEGDDCPGGFINQECAADGGLWTCTERYAWSYTDCTRHCQEQGFPGTSGCITTDNASFCLCDGGTLECTAPGQTACADTSSLLQCNDALTWSMATCEAICALQEPALLSRGCRSDVSKGDHCLCTGEGTSCTDDEATQCVGGEPTLAACVDGTWTFTGCDPLCDADEVGRCDPFAANGAACTCAGP